MNIFWLIWGIIGFIAWLFTYHSIRKQWFNIFGYEYWKSKYNSILYLLCLLLPFWVFGGLLSLIYWMVVIDKKNWSLYFNIKRYERKLLLKEFRNEYPKKQMKCLSIFDNISCSRFKYDENDNNKK